MKRAYNKAVYPPAPFLSIRFGNAELGLTTDAIEGLIDTGADTTIVPLQLLDQIESPIEGFASVHGQWGGSRNVNVYVVDVIVEGIVFPGIFVVGDEIDDGVILGRDVLNRMKLVLDGLKHQIEIAGY